MENKQPIVVRVATLADHRYAKQISEEMASSAKSRGTGIAQRSPEYLQLKMSEGKAVIAITAEGNWVGFCYIEAWDHERFVANSGLIVSPEYRASGVAKSIKRKIFELSRQTYPDAKIFGLTTGLPVMKINSELGYQPVTYSELTSDELFWAGCKSCVNYEILLSKNKKNCICTAMLFDPKEKAKQKTPENNALPSRPKKRRFKGNFKLFERWIGYKKHVLLKKQEVKKKKKETLPVL